MVNDTNLHCFIFPKNLEFQNEFSGMLGLGACLLGAKHVTGVDIDDDALRICSENIDGIIEDVDEDLVPHFTYRLDLIQSDVFQFERMLKLRAKKLALQKGTTEEEEYRIFDTVLLNPPFGTRIKGTDMMFLKVASELTKNAVYSLHKTTTREVSRPLLVDSNLLLSDMVHHVLISIINCYWPAK